MKIDLSKFLDENISSIPVEQRLELTNLKYNGREIDFIEPVLLRGNIYRVGSEKYIDASISYEYSEKCGRCLSTFTDKRTTKIALVLVDKNNTDTNIEEDFAYYEGEVLDLTEDIKSMILLDLPMKPICKDDCKGLCQVCGLDQNKGTCDCVVDKVDPRLAKLKDFFPED